MAKQKSYSKILSHPDREEIIAKLTMSIAEDDIYEWLASKYSAVSEKKFVISKSTLKNFKDSYLDFYQDVLNDINNTKNQVKSGEITSSEDLKLLINNTSAYKEIMLKTAEQELDIKSMVKNLCNSLEARFAAIFDSVMADPENIDLRRERILGELGLTLSSLLEKYYKFTEEPTQQAQQINNFNISMIDKYSIALQESVREVLSNMDTEASLLFIDTLSNKLNQLQVPDINVKPAQKIISQDQKIAEIQIINEKITNKLNETN